MKANTLSTKKRLMERLAAWYCLWRESGGRGSMKGEDRGGGEKTGTHVGER